MSEKQVLPATAETQPAAFTCESDDWVRSACKGLPFYKAHEGKRYCVLHYPDKEKVEDFRPVFEEKLKAEDFDFRGVWFPEEVNFISFKFNQPANFSRAIFSAEADFSRATFSPVASFSYAEFIGEANFNFATFSAETSFSFAIFKNKINFEKSRFPPNGYVNLQRTIFEKPEQVAFHSVTLRPHWFVEVPDIKKFNFTNVRWKYKPRRLMTWGKGVKIAIKELQDHHINNEDVYSLLSRACRQLALIEEDYHRYNEAADLRYWSMRASRLEKNQQWAFWRMDWWYWLASGYGERTSYAIFWLVAILLGFAFGYLWVGFEKPLESYGDALIYSLNVAALQKPEPKAVTSWARFLVVAETILGPLQAALLALAIRRKFMR